MGGLILVLVPVVPHSSYAPQDLFGYDDASVASIEIVFGLVIRLAAAAVSRFVAKLGGNEGDSKRCEKATGSESFEKTGVNSLELGLLAGMSVICSCDRDVPRGRESFALDTGFVPMLVGGHPHCTVSAAARVAGARADTVHRSQRLRLLCAASGMPCLSWRCLLATLRPFLPSYVLPQTRHVMSFHAVYALSPLCASGWRMRRSLTSSDQPGAAGQGRRPLGRQARSWSRGCEASAKSGKKTGVDS